VKGWDYAHLCEVFEAGIQRVRGQHIPAIFHIEEVTQPQGHSTSGSHERYKTPERLEWERNWDGLRIMRDWIIENALAGDEELEDIENKAKEFVRNNKISAWEKLQAPIKKQVGVSLKLMQQIMQHKQDGDEAIQKLITELSSNKEPGRRDVLEILHRCMELESQSDLSGEGDPREWTTIRDYYAELLEESKSLYNTHLYHEGGASSLRVNEVSAEYEEDAPMLNGYEILNKYFDALFSANPKVMAFGEDVGKIGDVNQGFAGLQNKHGSGRIFDTGIREMTIIGQGIGLAFRGLRPIAEIQYLDYLLYGIQTLSDDLATLQYRTAGRQSAPLIVRTRGHRLEGIWHSGSPMGMILNSLRGMFICVPRNMVQAAGMYNTLLDGLDPALVIESLNGYRLKERLPENLLNFRVPLGIPEILREGEDISLVSYGSTLRIVQEAAARLEKINIHCEVIDVQTLLPFDRNQSILQSLKKTNRILFIDEDVPGGAAAYMFNKVMEEQGGYRWLDVSPRTLTAKAHRPAYASDGDYFSKPNTEDIIESVKQMMKE
jgi:pyruvate/2-oxoglutarate/acetoin dehydrogenase E1 component